MRLVKQIRLRDKQRGYLSAAMKLILFGGIAPSFELPLNDKGAGEVNLVPSRANGNPTPTFTRATTAYTTLSDGTLFQVASGVPRSCYSSAGVYLGYLAEGARTNLCLQSQTFDAVGWSPAIGFLLKNAIGPDGVTNSATTITDANVGATEYVTQTVSLTNATTYTQSIFVKKTVGALSVFPTFGVFTATDTKRAGCTIDTTNGTVVKWTAFTGSTMLAAFSCAIESTNTSYWRVSLTFTTESTSSHALCIVVPAALATQSADGTSDVALTGSLVIYGAQLEAASFASSYIPTTTAAVTRNADVLTYPSAGNADSAEGSFYAECTSNSWANTVNKWSLNYAGSGAPYSHSSASNFGSMQMYDGTNTANGPNGLAPVGTMKLAGRYSAATLLQMAIANGQLGAAARPFDGSMNATAIAIGCLVGGTSQFDGCIKNVRIYPRALSDAKLIAMTT